MKLLRLTASALLMVVATVGLTYAAYLFVVGV